MLIPPGMLMQNINTTGNAKAIQLQMSLYNNRRRQCAQRDINADGNINITRNTNTEQWEGANPALTSHTPRGPHVSTSRPTVPKCPGMVWYAGTE
jgi:hypothetical protein